MRSCHSLGFLLKRSNWTLLMVATLFALASGGPAFAQTYALSPDGAAVVRLAPQGTVSANTLGGTPLPGSYTVTAGSGASPAITSYAAGFRGANGGAQIEALYNNGNALATNQSLNWVQTINTNVPLGGAVSPNLDNAANPATPFYSYTAENRDPALPANQINFYDYSTRSPSTLSSTNPITWNAALYPVITIAGSTALTVENGVTWGWTMKPAMVGNISGTFSNPTPAGATTSGVGTNNFSWGNGDPSSLTFTGKTFDAKPGIAFDLGKLTFYNGSNTNYANNVDFNTNVNFDNVPEKNFALSTQLGLVNTINTDDPIASADYVTIGDYGFTFNVLEGAMASVDLMAELSATLTSTSLGTGPADSAFSSTPFNSSPNYVLTIVGLENVTSGGFTTGTVAEPSTVAIITLGLLFMMELQRRARRS